MGPTDSGLLGGTTSLKEATALLLPLGCTCLSPQLSLPFGSHLLLGPFCLVSHECKLRPPGVCRDCDQEGEADKPSPDPGGLPFVGQTRQHLRLSLCSGGRGEWGGGEGGWRVSGCLCA